MILEDFVMLGTTVPEPQDDGRRFVCSAGVSAERRSLVRIYPLARHDIPRRWGIYRVPVELNPKDPRVESFKVQGDRTPAAHEQINRAFVRLGEVPEGARARLLRPFFCSSIAEANDRRMSLAIVQPSRAERLELSFEHNPSSPLSPQLTLWPEPIPISMVGARRFPFIPRLRFSDVRGAHDLQLRDWGCYELMRKHLEDAPYYQAGMAKALHLSPASCLLVGNQSHRRNVWLVISVLNGLSRPVQEPLPGIASEVA
jgi:hypothetical protein